MRYRCHQCLCVVAFEDIAHRDIYSDLCWIQCDVCAAAFGLTCGADRQANPHPHGYFACPYFVSAATQHAAERGLTPFRPRGNRRPA